MKIRARVYASGRKAWQLDLGMVEGKRKMVAFESREEAERAMAESKKAKKRMGSMGVVLSPVEMAEFVSLREELRGQGATMREAVSFFLKHGVSLKRPLPLMKAVELFLDAKERAGKSLRTLQSYRQTLKSLALMHGETRVHELTSEDLRAWLNAQGWGARTVNGAMGFVRTFLAWCMRAEQGHATRNVALLMERRAEETAEEIGTLTLAECVTLLTRARRDAMEKGGVSWKLLAFVVIGMFGGLRRAELQRLRSEDVDLEERTVIVRAANAKTRQRRVVELTENAVAWLRREGETLRRGDFEKGRVCPSNLKELWPEFWRACGFEAWPKNGLRHTFASMHLAMWGDEARLQTQMGHESSKMLHRHYKALKTRKEAEAFWALVP
jgi:integrase